MKKSSFDVVIVGGLGHVGLPLGLLLADKGMQVALWDINEDFKRTLNSGKMPFIEYGAEIVLERVLNKTLHVADDIALIKNSDTVIVTIGTPLDDSKQPTMEPIMSLIDELSTLMTTGQHLMLRSTIFPGTSEKIAEYFSDMNLDIDISFCPERILQGHALQEFNTLAQIISGFSENAVNRASSLFNSIGIKTVVVTTIEAELAKLFTNSWRYIQFAISNQFYSIAAEHKVDFDNIYHAITYGYERASDMPRPGFSAGPCLYKDTMQLAAFCKDKFSLGEQAAKINQGMPNVIIQLIENKGFDISRCKVGILGMAFKADIDDVRDSLSYTLKNLLQNQGAEVYCSDDFVKDVSFISVDDLIKKSQVVVIGSPHSQYKNLKFPNSVEVIDPWHITAGNN